MSADPALIRLPLQAQLIRLDTGSAVRRVKSPPVDIPVALPLLPRWDELASWMQQIDRSRVYSNRGPLCHELEARLAVHYGCAPGDDAVCLTASGTLGLVACLLALDLEPGSICALPAWTFVASADAVVAAGLVPYLLDCELDTWALGPEHIEAQIAKMPQRPSVIMPVSPFGAPVDARAWESFAAESGIAVVIDAAAGFDSVVASSLPTVVSLHATTTLGVGEGGFVVCTNQSLIKRLRQVTNYGFSSMRVAHRLGLNAKLSEYHAAIGLVQLEKWRATRRTWLRVARYYRDAFHDHPAIECLPGYGEEWIGSTAVFRFVGHAAGDLADRLKHYNVDSRRWWHRGVNHHPAFAHTAASELVNAERLADEVLGLPCYLTLRNGSVRAIVEAVRKIVGPAPPMGSTA
ncbi:MAG: DegT/DnrJ/EryC1/StrS family aminotransferase [Gammaproteobacteria bacterium]|jgi:dTDP-4-amino-4,6-dideoxygalactose transaminase